MVPFNITEYFAPDFDWFRVGFMNLIKLHKLFLNQMKGTVHSSCFYEIFFPNLASFRPWFWRILPQKN